MTARARKRRLPLHSGTTATPPPQPPPDEDDPVPTVKRGASSVRWNAVSVIGRQAPQMVFALVLANILGPDVYGVISAAMVYVALTTFLLNQGLAPALIQRPTLTRHLPGAVATANLLTAGILAVATWFAAPAMAAFFHSPGLTPLLRVLGAGLFLKGVAITPRAMQQRSLRFAPIAAADAGGGALGAGIGIAAALFSAGVWSMPVQVMITDLIVAVVLLGVTRGVSPNLRLRELPTILPFSLRIFGSQALAFLSRNSDNILIGRFLGVSALSLYAMAYRVRGIPVQFVAQTTNRVVFPAFARLADRPDRLAANTLKVTELIAFVSIVPMAGLAVSSQEVVTIVMGPDWLPAAPILTVLAIAGAREAVFSVTFSLMRATGAGKLLIRYEIVATAFQVGGIVVGLQFDALGTAIGVTTAGFLLAPILIAIQHHLAAVPVRALLHRLIAPTHASLWGAGSYLVVRWLVPGDLATLGVGTLCYLAVAGCVLWVGHRVATLRFVQGVREMLHVRGNRQPPTASPTTSKVAR